MPNQTLQQTLVNTTPNDLRILNRKKLFALGVSRADADEILMHPWYSPWTETVVIDALSNVGVDPTAFLARASRALTEQDAVYFQRLAQVLAAYAQKTQLRSIRVESGVVSAQDVNGKVVIPLSCDYRIWSEQNADRFNGFAKAVQSDSDVKGLVVWVDGKISDDAQQPVEAKKCRSCHRSPYQRRLTSEAVPVRLKAYGPKSNGIPSTRLQHWRMHDRFRSH